MSLSLMANASYEKRQQRIMQTRRWFDDREAITVASVSQKTGYAESTVIKWAKDGNIPLFLNNDETVVPLTEENKPKWW
ncbi:hypothetical protein ACWCL1_08260 [Ligilactobacillus sp. LYQ135]